jgi:hypothetical protein
MPASPSAEINPMPDSSKDGPSPKSDGRLLIIVNCPSSAAVDTRTLAEKWMNWWGNGKPGGRFNPERKNY